MMWLACIVDDFIISPWCGLDGLWHLLDDVLFQHEPPVWLDEIHDRFCQWAWLRVAD